MAWIFVETAAAVDAIARFASLGRAMSFYDRAVDQSAGAQHVKYRVHDPSIVTAWSMENHVQPCLSIICVSTGHNTAYL